MSKRPLHYKDNHFYTDFKTTCYINKETMLHNFPLYRHDFIEISMVIEGEGIEIINGQSYAIQKASVSVTCPWHFHTIRTDEGQKIKRFICEFSMEDYLQYAKLWPASRESLFRKDLPPSLQFDEKSYEQACLIFNQMYDVFTDRYEFVDKQSYLYLKLTEFMMLFTKEQMRHREKPKQKNEHNLLENALRIMHERFRDDLLLKDLSEELGLHQRELSEQISAYTGMGFTELLNEIRLRNACVLLALKTPTIDYVVENSGFQSKQNFYRIFSERKGMTPLEYRQRYWKKSEGKAGYLMYNHPVWEIIYYLHRHYREDLRPETVAEAFSMSVSSLHKTLSENLYQSFSEILREIRIHYSCGLLAESDLNLTEIAIEVGYNNSRSFHRAFENLKGISPSEYREKRKLFKD